MTAANVPMTTAIGWEVWFNGINPKTGRPKDAFYRAIVCDSTVVVHHGKRDQRGNVTVHHESDAATARRKAMSLVRSKEQDGYRVTHGTVVFQVSQADATGARSTNSTGKGGSDAEAARRVAEAWAVAAGRA